MRSLYVIVVKARTNRLLNPHAWYVGAPVARGIGEFTGGPTFYVPEKGPVEAYESRQEAEDEIALRGRAFRGVEFEVVEFRR